MRIANAYEIKLHCDERLVMQLYNMVRISIRTAEL